MKMPTPAPEFYRGLAGRFADAYQPYTEAGKAASALQFMVYMSQVVGAGPYVNQSEVLKHRLNLWAIVGGRSSSGRKGTSHTDVRELFEKALPKRAGVLSGFSFKGFPQSGASLVRKLETMEAALMVAEPPRWPAFGHCPLLGFTEETANFFKSAAGSGDTLTGYMCELWEGRSVEHIISVGGKIQVSRIVEPHLAIIGHITPDIMQKVITPEAVSTGLLNRFLCVVAERSKRLSSPPPKPEGLVSGLINEIRACWVKSRKTGAINLSREAKKYWDEHLYDELTDLVENDKNMEDWIGRAVTYAMRLAGLYALMTQYHDNVPVEIQVDDLKSARAAIILSAESTRALMGERIGGGKASIPEMILGILTEHGPKLLTELRDMLPGRMNQRLINGHVKGLNGQVVCCKNPDKTGGRKGYLYCIEEDLEDGWEVIDLEAPEAAPDVIQGTVLHETAPARRPAAPPRQPQARDGQEDAARGHAVMVGQVIPQARPQAAPQPRTAATPPRQAAQPASIADLWK